MKKLLVPAVLCGISILCTATWMQAQQRKGRISTEDFVELQRALWEQHIGYDFADQDNGDLWLSMFTSDAILESGSFPPVSGEKGIRDFALNQFKNNPGQRARHWTSTFYATPNADGSATLVAFYFVVYATEQGDLRMTRGGYYQSQVVKTSKGWKFKHHRVFQEGDMVAAMKGTGQPTGRLPISGGKVPVIRR